MMTVLLATALAAAAPEPPGRGVSEALAAERAAAIQDLRYELRFVIPDVRTAPVVGRLAARLSLKAPHRLVFDFAQPADRLRSVRVNGRALSPEIADGHIVIPADATAAGANDVQFEFVAGDEALNRN